MYAYDYSFSIIINVPYPLKGDAFAFISLFPVAIQSHFYFFLEIIDVHSPIETFSMRTHFIIIFRTHNHTEDESCAAKAFRTNTVCYKNENHDIVWICF